jgi:Phage endonuclease I
MQIASASERTCSWCGGPIPEGRSFRSTTCSRSCVDSRKSYNRIIRVEGRTPKRGRLRTTQRRQLTPEQREHNKRYGVEYYWKNVCKEEGIVDEVMKAKARSRSPYAWARARGYRSGLEVKVAKQLEDAGVPFQYEKLKVHYTVPERQAYYLADYVLDNGIIVETKGKFEVGDRQKHLLIKKQHPELDIRFVFSNSNAPIYKGSPTSYAQWCKSHGFLYADKTIPEEWIKEAK